MEVKRCSVEDCGSGVLAKGLCSKHYDRVRKTGSTELRRRIKDELCAECGERFAGYSVDGRNLCQPCYRRDKNAKRPQVLGECAFCGTETPNKYCSQACKNKDYSRNGMAAARSRKSYYKRHYGMTLEEVETMRAVGCGICPPDAPERVEGRWGNLHIDHDHDTGKVRGALCHRHNVGLGQFNHSVEELQAAVAYLA